MMQQFNWKKTGIIFLGVIVLWGCSETKKNNEPEPDNSGTDRKAMLIHIADNIVIPGYANFKVKLDLMLDKSASFTSSPGNTTLTQFRQAWEDAYVEWQKVELFSFGPADNHTLRNYFNIYPATAQVIEQNITTGTVNMDLAASYPAQGFPALDYLINGLGSTDAEIVAKYTIEADAAKRIAYVKVITEKMNSMFTTVYGEWNSGYRDNFISKTSLDAGSPISLMVNGYILHYERYIRAGKFGIPSGAMISDGSTTYPDKVEAYYKKDISLTLAKAAHQAAIDFFNGKDVKTGIEGPSLKSYLNALGAKDSKTGDSLTHIINNQFTVANAKLSLLSDNLYQEVIDDNQAMVNVYSEMQKVVRMLKVDMTSAMSITITYADNDGD